MFGVVVNSAAVLAGSAIGLLLRRGMAEKYREGVMQALALCVLAIGILGLGAGVNGMALILAVVPGAVIGIALGVDAWVQRLGEGLDRRFLRAAPRETRSLGEGFVTATLLFCIGAMAVTGSLRSGLEGDHSILFAKSALDFVSAILLASSLGIGVMLSALSVFAVQGGIVLLARLIAPLLTGSAITAIAGTGSVLILALGLNMLNLTKIKVADLLPSLLLAPLAAALISLF